MNSAFGRLRLVRSAALALRRDRRRAARRRRQSHHRDLQPAVARRASAADHQGAEVRPGQRPRHLVPGAHAGRLHHAVQLRRVQGRRQRRRCSRRPRRHARRQGEVPVQPVRLLGRGRDLAARGQDAQGSRGQGDRRRARHHQLQMFEFFAKKQGVDVSKFKVVNTATPGLVSYAIADRADAMQLWEPAYTLLMAKKPGIRTLDLGIEKTWKEFAGGEPHSLSRRRRACRMGRRESRRWCKKLYATYKAAAEWIAEESGRGRAADRRRRRRRPSRRRMASLIRANDRLGISLVGGRRNPQGDRGRLQGRRRRRLFQQDAVGRPRSTTSRCNERNARSHAQICNGAASTFVLPGAVADRVVFLSALSVSAGAGRSSARTIRFSSTWPLMVEVLETAARIFAGLFGAFMLGGMLALLIGRSPRVESYITPVLMFLQGIPALSWVVIAVIWFHGSEFRIFFIMVITTLPAFTFQILDAYRSMSKDLFEMTMSFRPSALDAVPRADRADHRSGHPHRLEGQSRQCRARRGGGGAGRRDRRRRLSAAAPAAIVRHGGRHRLDAAARAVRAGRAADHQRDRELGCCATAPCRSGRCDRCERRHRSSASTMSSRCFRAPDGTRRPSSRSTGCRSRSRKGEIVAVLGKTGCGKSTMFNLLSGLIEPTSGKVEVIGHEPFREFDFFRGKIGIVFQNDRLMPWRTALDNVLLGLADPRHATPARGRSDGAALAGAARPDRPRERLSARAVRRHAPARLDRARLRGRAGILLCDEPFSSLDEMTARDLRAEFVRLVQAEPARPRCSSPITSTRRWTSATASWCSTARRGSPTRRGSTPASASKPATRCKTTSCGCLSADTVS